VMLPARNQRDLDDIPADARAQLRFVWMEEVDDAIRAAMAAPAAVASTAVAADQQPV
jgi:ATP-dependent Lon protease